MSRYGWQAPDGPWETQVLIVDQGNDNFTGANGRVTLVNQDGTKWTPSGGDVTSDNITDATAVGKSVLTAADAEAARTAIGAGTSSFTGAYGDLTGKPSIPSSPGDIGAATEAQGAKADSAVQPADLSPYAKTADLALANASVAANVATGSTVDDVIAALIAAGLMASA